MDSPWIQRRPISDEVLRRIFESDQDMYPAPLTYERLKSWVDGCQQLCICFQRVLEEGSEVGPVGVIIVLPLLKRHWEDVLVGKLKETDIEPVMFAGKGDADVGLHVFHVERFDAETRGTGFAETTLGVIGSIVGQKGWNVLGYSALTATAAGRAVFGRMGFTPTGYKELFVTDSDAARPTVDMICVYPGEGSSQDSSKEIQSKSQMVVRYADATRQSR